MADKKEDTKQGLASDPRYDFVSYREISKRSLSTSDSDDETPNDDIIVTTPLVAITYYKKGIHDDAVLVLSDGRKINNPYAAIYGDKLCILLMTGELLVGVDIVDIIFPEQVKGKGQPLIKPPKEGDTWYTIHAFSSPIENLMKAILAKEEIEGIPLFEKILDPNFRFVTSDDPTGSIQLSCILSDVAKESRARGILEGSKKGTLSAAKKRVEDADEFARNMYSIIEKEKLDAGVSTVRGTVELLNKNGIDSPNGGKWNKSSLQLVQKRWKELGLIPPTTPKLK